MAVLMIALQTVESGSYSQSTQLPGFIDGLFVTVQSAAGAQGTFVLLVVLAVLLQLLRSGFEYLGRVSSIYLRSWIEGDLRRRLFDQLVSIGYPQISRFKIGGLASYNDQVNHAGLLILFSNTSISDLTVILAYTTVLMWISWQMTLVAIIALGLVTISLRRVRTSIRQISTGFMGASVSLNERFVEYLHNIRLLHVFSREKYATEQVDDIINQSIRMRRRGLMRSAVIPLFMQSTTILGAALFLILGYLIIDRYDRGSYAGLATFVFILYRLMPRLSSLNSSIGQVSNEWPFMKRIAELLRTDDKEYETSGTLSFEGLHNAVRLDDVTLRYVDSDQDALKHVSLMLPAGQMTAFVGPSGSGKSSIVNLLLRLYNPSKGEITADDVAISQYNLASWRGRIGVVDQETYLFNMSALDNIRFGLLNATDDEVHNAARIANADAFIEQLPEGYDTEIGDRGLRLSGGQRQRIAIARAVLRNPDILVFDEATSSLDSHSERLIHESLEQLRKDRTVIVIAHRLSTTANADQIVVLDDGQISETGRHEELLRNQGLYARLWQLQSAIDERKAGQATEPSTDSVI